MASKPGQVLGAPIAKPVKTMMQKSVHGSPKESSKPFVSVTRKAEPVTAHKAPPLKVTPSKLSVQTAAKGLRLSRILSRRFGVYVPNNNALFNAAYSGFLAGVYEGKDATIALGSNYDGIIAQANVFAQAVDTGIAPGSPSGSQATFLANLCQSVMANKYSTSLPSSAFSGNAGAIVALYNEAASSFFVVTTPQSLVDPTIIDSTIFEPTTQAPATVAKVKAVFGTPVQTANNTPAIALTIPLPGTAGALATAGAMWVDVFIAQNSTTTAVGAVYKLSWGWSVETPGSPVAMGTLLTLLSTGTNTSAPPSGWSATMALDGGNANAVVTVTGPNGLTVNHVARAEVEYLH